MQTNSTMNNTTSATIAQIIQGPMPNVPHAAAWEELDNSGKMQMDLVVEGDEVNDHADKVNDPAEPFLRFTEEQQWIQECASRLKELKGHSDDGKDTDVEEEECNPEHTKKKTLTFHEWTPSKTKKVKGKAKREAKVMKAEAKAKATKPDATKPDEISNEEYREWCEPLVPLLRKMVDEAKRLKLPYQHHEARLTGGKGGKFWKQSWLHLCCPAAFKKFDEKIDAAQRNERKAKFKAENAALAAAAVAWAVESKAKARAEAKAKREAKAAAAAEAKAAREAKKRKRTLADYDKRLFPAEMCVDRWNQHASEQGLRADDKHINRLIEYIKTLEAHQQYISRYGGVLLSKEEWKESDKWSAAQYIAILNHWVDQDELHLVGARKAYALHGSVKWRSKLSADEIQEIEAHDAAIFPEERAFKKAKVDLVSDAEFKATLAQMQWD